MISLWILLCTGLGWTAWAIWRNREKPFKERYQKVVNFAKNVILQENLKNIWEMPQDVFLHLLMVLDRF